MMKVREIKHTNGDRPLILMGWGAGAAIAAHVAGVEKVNGKIPNRLIGISFLYFSASLVCSHLLESIPVYRKKVISLFQKTDFRLISAVTIF
jgi:hypothetical protein